MARNYVNLAEIMGQVDNARANESNLKRQQQQMQMEDYAYQKALKQDQEQEAMRGVYSGAIDTTGEAPKLDEQKLIQGLVQRGYVEQALKLQDQFRVRDMQAGKLQNEVKSSDLKYQMDLTNYAHDAMAGATPETWGMLKQDLMTKGVKAAEAMPDTFDPNFQSKFVMDAKSFREQNKPREYGTGVSYDENNRAFVMDKMGNPKFIGVSKAPETPSKPASIQEYEYAKNQGYEGSLNDYQASSSRPKLKQGERYKEDGTVEAIKGSDLFIKQANTHGKDYAGLKAVNQKTDNAIAKITKILADEKGFSRNFGGYNAIASSRFPDALDAKNNIDSLKSDLKSAGLEMMRVGGSIGAMTEREWPIVESMIAKIDPTLSEDEAKLKLNEVAAYLSKIKTNASDSYDTEWGDTQFHKNKPPENPLTLTLPNGKTATFKSKAMLDAYKKHKGLK